ncbi:hypothetical protein [Persicobacter psychrovividus]|uniref:Outer membrane protein beta-barrel domain-containing protein n=1 Tax=Persicobacter psychrovividus TaxID=387638 RepID=A0ABN6L495_9BACT|nr:hypothetical protein PEPS_01580 [Persicobacter psychrovividus]
MKTQRFNLLFFLLILTTGSVFAQGRAASKGFSHHTNLRSKWSFGASVGSTTLNTDALKLADSKSYFNPLVGIGIHYQINNYWSASAHLNFFSQTFDGGSLPMYKDSVSLAFSSRNIEYYAVIRRKILTSLNYLKATQYWDIDLFVGLGNVMFIHEDYSSSSIRNDGFVINNATSPSTDNISMISHAQLGIIVPVGLGFNYHISDKFTVNIEGAYRFSTSDFLDGIKVEGQAKDGYFYSSIGVVYRPWNKSGTKYLYNQHLKIKQKNRKRSTPKKVKSKNYRSTNKL